MSAAPHLLHRLNRWIDRLMLRARVRQLQQLIGQIETETEISHDSLAKLRLQLACAHELLRRAERRPTRQEAPTCR